MKNIRQFIALVLILCLSTGLTAVLAESVPAEQLFPVRPTNSDQYIIDSDRTLSFPYLKAGTYCIRITEDINRNSIVDSGSLLQHRQPEKVKFFKLKDDFRFEVMEAAEIEQVIDVGELFKD